MSREEERSRAPRMSREEEQLGAPKGSREEECPKANTKSKRSKETKKEHMSKRIDYELGTTYLSTQWRAWGRAWFLAMSSSSLLLAFPLAMAGLWRSTRSAAEFQGTQCDGASPSVAEHRRAWRNIKEHDGALKPAGDAEGNGVWVGSW
jgi:hypothetical protein